MKILFLATVLLSTAAVASHHEKKEMNLEEIKQKISKNMDEKITVMTAHKTCVQASKTKEALKACQDSHKESMKKFRHERKEKRKIHKNKKK